MMLELFVEDDAEMIWGNTGQRIDMATAVQFLLVDLRKHNINNGINTLQIINYLEMRCYQL